MKKPLNSVFGIAALTLAASMLPVQAQTTLPRPNTTGDGSVAAVTPPYGADRSLDVANPTNPGATGNTIIEGDKSTMRGDRAATYDQKSGTLGR